MLNVTAFSPHIDIEKPEALSAQHVVFLHFDSGSSIIEYPIHLRYHAPTDNQVPAYRIARTLAPVVWCKPTIGSSYRGLRTTQATLVASIPVGKRADAQVVSVFTLLVTVCGALLIVYTALFHQPCPVQAPKEE